MGSLTALPALQNLRQNAIGEGFQGIVFDLGDESGQCGKYAKLGYSPLEFELLQRAFDAGISVPAPGAEFLQQKTFTMDRIWGETLEFYLRRPHTRFSADCVSALVREAAALNRHICHNDLAGRNIMIEDPVFEDDAIVECQWYIIDFGQACRGQTDEWKEIPSLFGTRIRRASYP